MSPTRMVSRAIRPGSRPARRSFMAVSMPARISPSSGVEPPPESWRAWLGPDSGAMVQAPSGDAVTTPDCRTTSAIRTTARPSGTKRTASDMPALRGTVGERDGGHHRGPDRAAGVPAGELAEDRALPRRLQGHRGQGQHVVLREVGI